MNATSQAMTLQHEPLNDGQHAKWIAGRVQVLLSHYFQPDNPQDVSEAALDDWISALAPFSQDAISRACEAYIRDQPRRRPTPGDVRGKIREPHQHAEKVKGSGDRNKLTPDELNLLEDEILPTARRWLSIPALAENGRNTLGYWGEAV